jgi:hypothetical protein
LVALDLLGGFTLWSRRRRLATDIEDLIEPTSFPEQIVRLVDGGLFVQRAVDLQSALEENEPGRSRTNGQVFFLPLHLRLSGKYRIYRVWMVHRDLCIS